MRLYRREGILSGNFERQKEYNLLKVVKDCGEKECVAGTASRDMWRRRRRIMWKRIGFGEARVWFAPGG